MRLVAVQRNPTERPHPAPRLWPHAVALTALLLPLIWFVQPFGTVSIDEGAAAHQAVHLADGEGWSFDAPIPQIAEEHLVFPIYKSEHTSSGFAPLVRHPVYPLMLAGSVRVAGEGGMVLVSVLGLTLAALGAGVLARRFAEGPLPAAALWLTGVASPLLFDGFTLMAHTVGAAATAWLVVACLRTLEDGPRWHRYAALAGVLTCLAVLLRTEAILLAGAVVLTTLIGPVALRRHRWRVAGPVVLGSAGALVVERAWRAWLDTSRYVVGGPTDAALADPAGWFGGRWDGIRQSVLGGGAGRAGALLTGSCVLLLAAALLARRGTWPALVLPLTGAAVAMVLVRFGADADLVPGIVIAVPLIVVTVVLCAGRVRLPDEAQWALTVVAASAAAVVVFQYDGGGYVEWGGRYFAILLPVAIPVLLVALSRLAPRDRSTTRVVVGTIACCFLSSVLSFVTMRQINRGSDNTLEQIGSLAASSTLDGSPGDDRPVLITSHLGVTRLDWRRYDARRWLYLGPDSPDGVVPDPQVDDVRRALRGSRLVTLVTADRDRDLERIGPHEIIEEHPGVGPFAVLVLRL